MGYVRGKPVFHYNYAFQARNNFKNDAFKRNCFIYPIFTPSGEIITEGFPEKHSHHHGMFSAWVNTRFKNKKNDF
ncbi:DUF6807 family protein [Zunongwangia atlantica 22II14-10F7]|uniref:DUF6807 family protein n=1 Tax=Zunongwangia atlantica TaxID=1502297 RepID=UPI0036228216